MTRVPPAARAALWLAALTASQFAWARPTTFRGFDEWLILSMLSRGVVDAPYAHRPLAQALALPAWWLAPDRLLPILILHAAYLAAAAFFVFLTVRRAWPEAARLAGLAAAFTIVWSPTDPTRFCSTQMVAYSGVALAVAAAHWLLLRSWTSGSVALLALSALAAGVASLTHEAALPPLALAPAWLYLADAGAEDLRARRRRWTAAWGLVLAACGGWYLQGFLAGGELTRYQAFHLGERASVATTFVNLGARLGEHVLPLFVDALKARDAWAVSIALAVFLAGTATLSGAAPPRVCARAAAIGAAWTVLAHLPFAVSTAIHGPSRTQYVSAPGLGLVLAGLLCALAAVPRRRAGQAVALASSLWVVAQGTARTVAWGRYWDEMSAFPRQAGTLAELLRLAPRVEPDTLVVLLGETASVWKLELGFRHAVSYVYEERAIGHAPGALPFLYTTRFEPDGVAHEPDEVIRGPWHEPARLFAYDQLIVVRTAPGGRLALAESWPPELPPLPPGARYAPRDRILAGPPMARAALVLQGR